MKSPSGFTPTTAASVVPPPKVGWAAPGVTGKAVEAVVPVANTLPAASTAIPPSRLVAGNGSTTACAVAVPSNSLKYVCTPVAFSRATKSS